MLCIRPYRIHGGEFPCGACLPCSYNRRRMWTTRIVLESLCHQHNAFITLTYADIPRGHHGPPAPYVVSLDASHLRGFWKSLRFHSGLRLRYFAVGEYGDKSGRAHFHAAVFGLPATCADVVQKAWPWGTVQVGSLTQESAQYVAGYVCKKMIPSTHSYPAGRVREFARMSNRLEKGKPGGIGASAITALAASVAAHIASGVEKDVPAVVRVNGSLMPLGQYVRRKLRAAIGKDENMPQDLRKALMDEFLAMDVDLRERKRENTYLSTKERLKIQSSGRTLR